MKWRHFETSRRTRSVGAGQVLTVGTCNQYPCVVICNMRAAIVLLSCLAATAVADPLGPYKVDPNLVRLLLQRFVGFPRCCRAGRR